MCTIDHRFHYGVEEHAFYEEQGYYIFDNFLTEDALAACGRRVDPVR